MNDDAGNVEQHTADVIIAGPIVLAILSSAEDGIEQSVRVRLRTRHLRHRLDGSSVRGAGLTQGWIHDVVVATIRLSVRELGADI
jgi:hypothetical protein